MLYAFMFMLGSWFGAFVMALMNAAHDEKD